MNPLTAARRLVAPAGQHRAVPMDSPRVTRVAGCLCCGWDRLTTHAVADGVLTCQACGRRTAEINRAEMVPGTRWLVCDSSVCGHMTTRHVPADGLRAVACTWCGTVKGDQ